MFTESKKYIGPRLPPRTIVQGHGRDKEIVVLHIEQSDEFRGMIPKSSNKSLHEYDDRYTTRADLPFAIIGVFRIHPSIIHGAAREDLQNEIMPLVSLYRCDAITGDANKSANTYSKLQHVFNPANGLVNILMRAYQRLWNETKDLPLVDRMKYAMETSCTLKSIVRHHLYMKTGSGYDRTFPDVISSKQAFWKDEMNGMDDEQLQFMRNNPTKAIFDYQVSSAVRFKHVNNDMFMNGSQDSDSHSPRSHGLHPQQICNQATALRDTRSTSRRNNPGPRRSTRTTISSGDIRSSGRTIATRPGMIMETMAVNPTAAADGIVDPTDHEDLYVQRHELQDISSEQKRG